MVKLRSRLIRSPILLPESSSGIEGGEAIGGGHDQLPNPGDRASLPVAEAATAVVAAADQRRPIDSVVSDIAAAAAGVPGKRKPENRSLTASIRRAKTAMFRIATSPTTSSSFSPGSDNDRISLDAGRSRDRVEICNGGCDDDILHSQGGGEGMTAGCNGKPANFTATTSTSSSHQRIRPATSNPARNNVLEWMNDDAPSELLPKILSFCGSRKLNALSRVNKRWNAVMRDDSVWRTLCEDTHKVCHPHALIAYVFFYGGTHDLNSHNRTIAPAQTAL